MFCGCLAAQPDINIDFNALVGAQFSACSVVPLPPVVDADALTFEYGTGSDGPVNMTGLMPAMARALEKFQQMIAAAGGKFELKSAYRPPTYQAHLQDVWYKWMEVRNNREPGCQGLRAQVEGEFSRHHLIESQKPVTSSDHTRGLAFDAVVVLPKVARVRRMRVSLDRLALLSGIRRPDILRDPVHFKLASSRRVIRRA
jgi:D-alanyl-D-alanine dipeptidase